MMRGVWQHLQTRAIRTRLIVGATLVLITFVLAVGWAVQRAHADSVRTAHYAQLQGTVYLLLAGAEVDADGNLVMPATLTEPRLGLPDSGLYARVRNEVTGQSWQSASAIGGALPFLQDAVVGQWRFETRSAQGRDYLVVGYGVRWVVGDKPVPLALSVLEDSVTLERESAAFRQTLWTWLGGAGVLLLASQAALLQWGLAPLRRVSQELQRIEHGDQTEVEQQYPIEIAALTDNINTLVRQERVRQTRFKEALSYLAHSLKTPLAVLRSALEEPARLPAVVAEQVARMDAIVQHQLGRAAASGQARFVPFIALAPVLTRIRDALAKVHADKNLEFTLDCPENLQWRIDDGDAFELFGNLMDNASKWATHRVAVRLRVEPVGLLIQIDDDGPGFPHDTHAMLQLHVRGDEKVAGHGIGLAMVNELVASHQGTLVLTRSDWGGARVVVTLPAA